MPNGALAAAVATLLEHQNENADRRYIDLAVSLRLCDVDPNTQKWLEHTDEVLLEAGGRWDRRKKRWAGDALKVRVIRVHRGQEKAARWFAEWFKRRAKGPRGPQWDDFRRVWSVLLLGGRRGGKSHLACIAVVVFAAMVPGARVWAISPTQEETDELEQAIRSLMPRGWYRFRGGGAGKPLQFRLSNGARILCLSGHKPRALKRGRVDFALYNEAQNMHQAGWIQLRGAIADRGGIVCLAANPPDAEIGRWIESVYEQAVAGKNLVELFELTAKNNPFVEYQALADLKADLNDPVTFAREIEGRMMPIGDVVFHQWLDSECIKEPPPDFIDVTAEFTRKTFGRAFGYVVGMDFQKTPHMPAAVYRFFRDPQCDPADVIAWIVDEVVCEDADENDLLDALEAMSRWKRGGRSDGDTYRGWIDEADDRANPVHCAIVMDASGFWQDGAHQQGRTSEKVLRARRWTFLYRPQKDLADGEPVKVNPNIMERVKATNAMLKSQSGKRRMFSCPHNVHTNRAMRSWPNKNGFPHRTSQFAHVCDAVSYPIYRLFALPKPPRSEGPKYEGAGRFKRGAMFSGR